ncbi:MAG: polysaccharide deacetylase family protein [bacterium]|nr:polysaccharide deacetylase family protein [bacterium]
MKGIMYHYIRKANSLLPNFKYLDIEDFRKQLDYFQDKFGFVTKEDFINSFDTRKPVSGVVLTFDDGLKDHYEFVLPELLSRNLWGIFYVPYKASERKRLLGPHGLHMLLGKFGGQMILENLSTRVSKKILSHEHIKAFQTLAYKGLTDDRASTEVKRILNYYIDEKHREQVIDDLINYFFKNEPIKIKDFYLSAEEIKKVAEAGMIVGAHTINHPVMSKLNYKEQEKEILPCFEFLEKIIDQDSIRTYCHPYGGDFSFNKDTEKILENAHCLFSFSVEPRDIESADLKNHRQSLPRYDCNIFPHGQVRSIV